MFYACLILPGLVEFRSNSVSVSGYQILAGNWAAKMRPDTHVYTQMHAWHCSHSSKEHTTTLYKALGIISFTIWPKYFQCLYLEQGIAIDVKGGK